MTTVIRDSCVRARTQVSFMILLTIVFAGLYDINQSAGGESDTYIFLDRLIYFSSGFYFSCLVGIAIYYVCKLRQMTSFKYEPKCW
jgi:hypothetical protein